MSEPSFDRENLPLLQARFSAPENALAVDNPQNGIGLLGEKRLHRHLKLWLCGDESRHEVAVLDREGTPTRYVADILTREGHIFEVQTGSLYPLAKKIGWYLENTTHSVTVVHPLYYEKHICWLNPETGEETGGKRSPQRQTPVFALAECRYLLPYLGHPRLSLLLPSLSVREVRLLDGWGNGGKRGSHRQEMQPLALLDICTLSTREDYKNLLPSRDILPESFTARQLEKVTRLRGYALYRALTTLVELGALAKDGKKGNAALYRRRV